MRESLKRIASFYNPAQLEDGGQMAARDARRTLEELGLLFQGDLDRDPGGSAGDSEER